MDTSTRVGRTGRRVGLSAVLVTVTLILSSCYYWPNAVNHEQNMPATRPWWCHSTGTGGHHVDPAYEGMAKGMLSWTDCKNVSLQFDLAIAYAMQWPTLGDAEAAGFHRFVNYVGGMGTHHAMLNDFDPTDPGFDPTDPSFPGTALDGNFDPTKPEFLMYSGNSSDSELVGFAWYVKTDSTTPPEGFPGDNDWWHRHERLCFSNSQWRVIGEDLSDAACQSASGTNLHLQDWWMSHAWVVDPWVTEGDVFTNHHPCLHPSGPETDPDDPCWDESGHGEH